MPCLPAASHVVTITVSGIEARHGLSRSAVYRAIRDRGFPQPLKVGSRSYWIASECDAWFAARAAERDHGPADAAAHAAAADLREARRRAGLASAAARRARREAAAAAPDIAATA